jgi:L-ribulose-5-phosphate 4-epimerase
MIAGDLRERVYRANRWLSESGLILGTFGNVSGLDRQADLFVIKPSGVPYDELTPGHMVPVSLSTGSVLDSALLPSSDTPTHLELYRRFSCGGIAHTHSRAATTLAQARLPVRCMGTTHADYFRGDVPVTRPLREEEVREDYERYTGLAIVEIFEQLQISSEAVPGVLVANHGAFTWGPDAMEAARRSEVLEFLAEVDIAQRAIAPDAPRPDGYLIDKHYFRKHGARAYYGQRRS